MAIDAGLGELGRHGVVITPKYGSRVRLAKVITDMPLVLDRPISFGVTEFCEICAKCAEECPGEALPHGSRSYDAPKSGNPGVFRWAVDNIKCHRAWCEFGMECNTCIRVCPFTKPEGWMHEITKMLIGGVRSKSINKLLLKLDSASGYGKGKDPRGFWKRDRYIHVKT
jgi:reductive dehalogenase